jgi:hypothetical protein
MEVWPVNVYTQHSRGCNEQMKFALATTSVIGVASNRPPVKVSDAFYGTEYPPPRFCCYSNQTVMTLSVALDVTRRPNLCSLRADGA